MPTHASLTGADLHEPKGVAAASSATFYAANGSGSGTWRKIAAGDLNTASVFNINDFYIHVDIQDIGTAQAIVIPTPFGCTCTKITGVLNGTITGANSTITYTKNGAGVLGTTVVTFSGSAAGDTYTNSPVSNNTFVTGDYLRISNDGASTGPMSYGIVVTFTRTS